MTDINRFIENLKFFRCSAATCAMRLCQAGYNRENAEEAMGRFFPRNGRKAVKTAYYQAAL